MSFPNEPGRQDQVPACREMREFLRQRLPQYMVPATYSVLESLPLTGSGKVSRRDLPALDWSRSEEEEQAVVAPRTPAEERLAGIWTEVLGVNQVGLCDNFFELGGHSLLTMRLLADDGLH